MSFGSVQVVGAVEPPADPTYYVTIAKTTPDAEITLSVGQQYSIVYTITVNVSQEEPTNVPCFLELQPDECVYVVDDTHDVVLGSICYVDGPPVGGTYTVVSPVVFYVCGDYTVVNTACLRRAILTSPTPSSAVVDSSSTPPAECCASASVTVHVPCEGGCTLTPGYWKTHSQYGPAPYDDTWAALSAGTDTPFFLSEQTYYEVLWTAPAGGNAYYILAHAYIAAQLNRLNGASMPEDVLAALNAATALFEAYTPDAVAEFKGRTGREERQEFIRLAEILDAYNNGLIGPGHCSE